MIQLAILVIAFSYVLHEINNLALIRMANNCTKETFTCANKKMMKRILKSLK